MENLDYRYFAPAKVNFILKIGDKNPKGLHNIVSLIRKIAIFDKISFSIGSTYSIKAVCGKIIAGGLPPSRRAAYNEFLELNLSNENNIIVKCARLFFNKINVKDKGLNLYIEKNIPLQAGLGGGSSDAAGVLIKLNKIFNYPLSMNELIKLALEAGSDIPFFLTGRDAIVTGSGEVIKEIPKGRLTKYYIVIIVPGFGISTKDAYGGYDDFILTKKLNYYNIYNLNLDSFLKDNRPENDFEPFILGKYPILKEIKDSMMDFKAKFSLLSGSGSAVFGGFTIKNAALRYFTNIKTFNFSDNIFLSSWTTTL